MMATMDMGAQGVTEDEAETIDFIKERIWLDPLAVDLQLSLFIAAMNSYRHDTVLRPFPPMFQSDDKEKDIKTMVSRWQSQCWKLLVAQWPNATNSCLGPQKSP